MKLFLKRVVGKSLKELGVAQKEHPASSDPRLAPHSSSKPQTSSRHTESQPWYPRMQTSQQQRKTSIFLRIEGKGIRKKQVSSPDPNPAGAPRGGLLSPPQPGRLCQDPLGKKPSPQVADVAAAASMQVCMQEVLTGENRLRRASGSLWHRC